MLNCVHLSGKYGFLSRTNFRKMIVMILLTMDTAANNINSSAFLTYTIDSFTFFQICHTCHVKFIIQKYIIYINFGILITEFYIVYINLIIFDYKTLYDIGVFLYYLLRDDAKRMNLYYLPHYQCRG